MNPFQTFFALITDQIELHPEIRRSLLHGIWVVIAWPVLIPQLSRISHGDHFQYLIFHNPGRRQDELKEQITRLSRLVDEHEYLSFDIQQRIQDHIDHLYRKTRKPNQKESNREYYSALQSNTNIHDVTRSFLQVNEIYTILLGQGKDDSSIHRYIEDLSNAKLAIYKLKPGCSVKSAGKYSLSKSFQTLRALHNRVDVFPEEARDPINLEVLRFLTFTAMKLETTKECEKEFTSEVLAATRNSYTKRAEEIRSRNKQRPTNSQFLRKYFWIEASNLLNAIEEEGRRVAIEVQAKEDDARKNTLKPTTEKTAECILRRMKDSLPPEFLNAKLNQYKKVYEDQQESGEDRKEQSSEGSNESAASTRAKTAYYAIDAINNFLVQLKEGQIGSSSSCPEKG